MQNTKRKNSVDLPINKKKYKSNKLPRLKSSKVSKIVVTQPGAYVRNPNYTPQPEKSAGVHNPQKTKLAKVQKKRKTEIGQIVQNEGEQSEKCTLEDLRAWSFIPLPDPILNALADLKFIIPTPIQELTLPAAILGILKLKSYLKNHEYNEKKKISLRTSRHSWSS